MVLQRISKIYLLTHGGLGNQLFQLNYAMLLARKYDAELCLFHNNRYYHGIELCKDFIPLLSKERLPVVFKLRLIKILKKLNIFSAKEQIKIGKNIYLDGYFQDKYLYESYSLSEKLDVLIFFRNLLCIDSKLPSKGCLKHLRVGDFFTNQTQKENHIREILYKSEKYDQFITNEESLVKSIMKDLDIYDREVVSSEQLTNIEVLRLMASYDCVITNGSTLATWATILGGGRLESDRNQMNLRNLF